MKKGMTMDEYMNELENQKLRAEAFKAVLEHLDTEIEWKMDKIEIKAGYNEEYVDEETGETKKKWHWAEYEKDENGCDKRIPPEEGSYQYPMYKALLAVKDEILAII